MLEQRRLQPEIMDQPGLHPLHHARALRGLARINWWSRSAGILWLPLAELARRASEPLRVLDLATGAGDVPIRLCRRARRAGVRLQIEGCNLSPVAVDEARRRAEKSELTFACLFTMRLMDHCYPVTMRSCVPCFCTIWIVNR